MRAKLIAMTTTTLATIALACAAHGQTCCTGGYCPRPPGRVVWYRPAPAPVRYVVVYQAPAPAAYTPAPAAEAPAQVQPPAPAQWSPGDEAAAFLAALNQWRAWHGRHPLSWDVALAGYAASNAGVHAPGSSGGASQCWAGTSSLMAALEMWKASPAHAAILLNATTSVGASPCPTGATANAR